MGSECVEPDNRKNTLVLVICIEHSMFVVYCFFLSPIEQEAAENVLKRISKVSEVERALQGALSLQRCKDEEIKNAKEEVTKTKKECDKWRVQCNELQMKNEK